jgi:ABC-type multidrug transport system permease subunit
MSIQEKKAVFNILTSILILGGYVYYTFVMHESENMPQINDIQFWAKFTLTMMIVTIVLKIISLILFTIINAIITRGQDEDFMDELDKKIEMKSDRNGNYFFMAGFVTSMIPIAMGKPVYYMFIIMLAAGFIAGTLGDLWKIYYYRRGI